MSDVWSEDFEMLHWVVERFERNGTSIEVGEVPRVFPEEQYDSVRSSLRRMSAHSYHLGVKSGGRGRPPVLQDVSQRKPVGDDGSWADNAELLADRMLAALVEGAVNEPDPEKRFKLKAGLDGIGGMTRDVLVGVVAAAIARPTGDARSWTRPCDTISHDRA